MREFSSEIRKFWKYSPQRLLLTALFLLITVIFEPIAVSFILAFLSVIFDFSNTPGSWVSELIFYLKARFSTWELLGFFCLTFLLKFFIMQLAFWYAAQSVAGYAHHLRVGFFTRVVNCTYRSLVAVPESKIMSTVGVDSLHAGTSITASLRCFVDVLSLLIYTSILVLLDWRAFALSLLVMSMIFVTTKIIGRSTVRASEKSLSGAHQLSEFMKNVIRGYRSLAVYGLQLDSRGLFKSLSASLCEPHQYNVAVGQYLRNVNEALQIVGLASILVIYWAAFGYTGVDILGALAIFRGLELLPRNCLATSNKFQSLVPYLRNFGH